jgi:hypothetical protein
MRKILYGMGILTLLIWIAVIWSNMYAPKPTQIKHKPNIAQKDSLRNIKIDTVDFSGKDSVDFAMFAPIVSTLWDTLKDLKYESKGAYGYIPQFSAKQKKLEGKQVTIQGYMYPLENSKVQKWFMLSYFPASACFFCGAAGPETVLEVNASPAIPIQNDKKITMRGVLKLNTREPERLFYILNDAKQVK